MVEPKETKPGLMTHIKTYGGLIAVLVLAVYFLFDVNVSIKGKPFMSDLEDEKLNKKNNAFYCYWNNHS